MLASALAEPGTSSPVRMYCAWNGNVSVCAAVVLWIKNWPVVPAAELSGPVGDLKQPLRVIRAAGGDAC